MVFLFSLIPFRLCGVGGIYDRMRYQDSLDEIILMRLYRDKLVGGKEQLPSKEDFPL